VRIRFACLITVSCVAVTLALAQKAPPADSPAPKGYVCYRAPSPITIDGKLDDAAWAAAPWSDDFADIEGSAKPKPTYRTRMKMLWDDEALYIAAEITEPHVWATLTKHNSVIFQDPDFEVFLDPDGDSHLYAEFEMNALNTTWDLLLSKPYKDGGHAINAWEITGLKTAVHVNGTINDPSDKDVGWTVEIRWPYEGLKEISPANYPPKNRDRWRINFSRVEWDIDIKSGKYEKVKGKPEHNWVWSPQGVIDMHRPERWGYVQFSTAKPGTATFEPDPDAPVRDALHRVYYAQRAYRKVNGSYAKSMAALGLSDLKFPVEIETTRGGYEAGAKGSTGKRMTIHEDARIGPE
jgi:hypothetical protein